MRLIILVGFSRGLGKSLLEKLKPKLKLKEIELLALGRNVESVEDTQVIKYRSLDLEDTKSWLVLTKNIPESVSELDIIFNASVIEPIHTIGNLEPSLIDVAISVNYNSPVMMVNYLAKLQQERNFAMRIVNITSGASKRAIGGWGLYCSSKAALRMFLDVLTVEASSKITVQHIDPGVLDTDMQSTIRSKVETEMKDVELFRSFESDKKLKSPYLAAEEILSAMGLNK